MCRDCGCEQANHQANEHAHKIDGVMVWHSHENKDFRKITVEESVLAKNDRIAQKNREWFKRYDMRVINLISSPGSGKTFLLEKTSKLLCDENPGFKMVIITGDQEGDYDAQRLRASGADVLQLNTKSACHLDAEMIHKQLDVFVQPEHRLLIIENVGNLVCPAAFDLGEKEKVALLSIPEGEDKPAKYPLLFSEASLIALTKIDLEPYLDWDMKVCEKYIRQVNASVPILRLSAMNGEGMQAWMRFLLS